MTDDTRAPQTPRSGEGDARQGNRFSKELPAAHRPPSIAPTSSRPTSSRPASVPPRAATGTQPTRSNAVAKTKTGAPPKPPRQPWVRVLRRIAFWGAAVSLALSTIVIGGMGIVYANLNIPAPDDFAQAQASTFYFSDGVTVMGRLGVANRENISIADLPEWVPHAVVAAEDRSFYSNPGIDILGMARGLFKTVVLGRKQGGSTITQQYVERYYAGETTTDLVGKAKEALLALKIDKQQDKSVILENYLNTIYFGRGAYGIQAAAREYYGKPAAELTVSEAAMLAGIIPAPSSWDPRNNHEQAVFRWGYVLDGMVSAGFLDPVERLKQVFPEPIEYVNRDVYAGPSGYILKMAIQEVADQAGISVDEIESMGYQIITTIDVPTQTAVEESVAAMPNDHSANLRVAVVTLDPNSGAILGLYGGADYLTVQRNAVTQDVAQAGSTFKPFALAAGVDARIALETEFNGDSGLEIDGFSRPVKNFGNKSYGTINLIDATANSVNTVYVQLAAAVGPEQVRQAAIDAGLPEDTLGLESNPANVLGSASPHPLDMAEAYATFASAGVHHDPYLVARVVRRDGSVLYEHELVEKRVFSSAVMAEVTYAMQQVVNYGSGNYANSLGRPIAGKTGTSSDNKSAWFIGFTPQVVTAVALYQVGADGSTESITPFGGFKQITGGSVPVRIWTAIMARVLTAYPVVAFPDRSYYGDPIEPSPVASPSASASPSPSPSPSITIIPVPTPSPSGGGPIILPSPGPSGGLGGIFP